MPIRELVHTAEVRAALARHDIATAYRLLAGYGVSQRQIATATGQTQSEVSEILAGRKVFSVSVLERIADGLGVPRGVMGLGYGPVPCTHEPRAEGKTIKTMTGTARARARTTPNHSLCAHGTAPH